MVVKGKPLTLKEHWQKLCTELKGMTFREKLEHLWEYYKWVLAIVLGAIFVICTVVAAIISLNTETILAGSIINVPLTPEGMVVLQEDYKEYAKTEGRQTVELTNFNFLNPYTTVQQTYTMNVMENVTAMITADALDYVIYDEVAAPFFMTPEQFMDLREMFSDEELEAMGNAVIWMEVGGIDEETGVPLEGTGVFIPLAIDIRCTEFYAKYVDSDEPMYLSFSIITSRAEECERFWQYIKGGQTEGMQTMLEGTVVDGAVKAEGKTRLTADFFQHQGYVLGDYRVELSEQSFLPAPDFDGEDPSPKIKANVLKTLKDGTLDYVLCNADALAQLEKASLLDLSKLLSQEELTRLQEALILDGDRPVALDITALPFGQQYTEGTEPVYLAFSANTQRLEILQELWAFINVEVTEETPTEATTEPTANN